MIAISEALPNELNVIRHLAQMIWPVAYGNIISAPQINYMLDLFYSDEKLNADLASEQNFLLAKHDGKYVGFAAIQHHWNDRKVTRIHKIYVLPEFQGTGIGKMLMSDISKRAIQHGDESLSLNVNRQNTAQDFYRHIGFEVEKSEDIDIGHGYLMEDFVMEKRLIGQ